MSCKKECVFPGCWVEYLQISTMSLWSNVWRSSEVSLLIFCLDYLSIGDSEVFRSPTITVLVFICAFKAIRVFFLM
jgi:hypothetical protein